MSLLLLFFSAWDGQLDPGSSSLLSWTKFVHPSEKCQSQGMTWGGFKLYLSNSACCVPSSQSDCHPIPKSLLQMEVWELWLQNLDRSHLHSENLFWQWNELLCFYYGPQLAWRHVAKVSRLRDAPRNSILWQVVSKSLSHTTIPISWHSLLGVILQVGRTCDLFLINRI